MSVFHGLNYQGMGSHILWRLYKGSIFISEEMLQFVETSWVARRNRKAEVSCLQYWDGYPDEMVTGGAYIVCTHFIYSRVSELKKTPNISKEHQHWKMKDLNASLWLPYRTVSCHVHQSVFATSPVIGSWFCVGALCSHSIFLFILITQQVAADLIQKGFRCCSSLCSCASSLALLPCPLSTVHGLRRC